MRVPPCRVGPSSCGNLQRRCSGIRATSGTSVRVGQGHRMPTHRHGANGRRSVQSYVVAASLCPVLLTMLPAGVTHPAGADVGACVVQHPLASCRGAPARPGYRRMIGQVARSMGSCMRGFRSEFAADDSNPQRTVGICAGQGGASRGSRPCPLPPDEDGQGLRCLHRVPSPATPFSHVRNLTRPTDSQPLSHDTTHRYRPGEPPRP